MARVYNLARVATATTGTGTMTLGSAVTGFLTFGDAGVQTGETVTYAIQDGSSSEIGYGVYTSSGTTLTRATILKSTNSGSAINLSGNAQVFITPSAEDLRTRLTANTTFYVRSTGSDSNSGVANTDASAFATLQGAWTAIYRRIDTQGYTVTIQVADGTYTAGLAVTGPLVGGGELRISGNESTPANVIISTTSADCISFDYQTRAFVYGFKFQTMTAGSCIRATNQSYVLVSAVNFGAAAESHVSSETRSTVYLFGTYTISAGAVSHVHGTGGALVLNTATVTLSGTPAFSAYYVGCAGYGTFTNTGTFSGSATGKQFLAHNFGVVDNSGGSTALPGSTNGESSDSGLYISPTATGTTLGGSPLDSAASGNLAVNASMEVSQVNGTTAVTLATGTAAYAVDCWSAKFVRAATLACEAQQVTTPTPPVGYRTALQLKATTGLTTLATGDYAYLSTPVEGYRVAKLGFGVSGTRTVSIGFWVYTTIAGTMAVAIQNGPVNRSYVTNVTISAATTWEYKTIQVPVDTTGTWNVTTGVGLRAIFCFGAGATFQGTVNTWTASNIFATSSTTNFMATTNNIAVVTGVLMLPSIAQPTADRNPYMMRSFDEELRLSMRYFCKSMKHATAPADGVSYITDGLLVGAAAVDTSSIYGPFVHFPVPMLAAPTVTMYRTTLGASAGKWAYFAGGWTSSVTTSTNSITETGFSPTLTSAAAFTANAAYGVAGAWTADVRLTA